MNNIWRPETQTDPDRILDPQTSLQPCNYEFMVLRSTAPVHPFTTLEVDAGVHQHSPLIKDNNANSWSNSNQTRKQTLNVKNACWDMAAQARQVGY